jgi:hypothetical protein
MSDSALVALLRQLEHLIRNYLDEHEDPNSPHAGPKTPTPSPQGPPDPQPSPPPATPSPGGDGPTIRVVNKSSLVSNADAATMTVACQRQIAEHVAPDWRLTPLPVTFDADGELTTDPLTWTIALMDDGQQAGVLGFHTEGANATISGKVFCKPQTDHGSGAFTGDYPISATLSHECAELFVDANCNAYRLAGQNKAGQLVWYVQEVSDPTESDYYPITVAGADVPMSNYILPAWCDPQAAQGAKMDHLGLLAKPFAVRKGGYVAVIVGDKPQQVFGERMPEWRREQKRHPASRSARSLTVGNGETEEPS